MENPFIFGEVVQGPHFTDRVEELKTLTVDLSSGQNVLLFSPRRYGKTSLIFRAMEVLGKRGILCVYVDLFRVSSLMSFGKIYAQALTLSSASKLQQAIQFVRDHFPTIVPKIIMKGDAPAEIEIDFDAPRRDLEKWLDGIYEMPEKIAQKRKKRLVVVFDEFQEVAGLAPEGALERALRSRIQHHHRVSYVFMGSKRHLLAELFLDKARPLYNIAKSFPLGKISPSELTSFIRARFKSVHIAIRPAEMEEILALSDRHPYYTQQLCHEIYNIVTPRKEVSPEDIPRALESCLAAQSYAYTTIWDTLAGKQRDLIVGLSRTEAATIYSQEFIRRFGLGSSGSIQKAIDALLKKGLVEREGDRYYLSDVFFAEWIRRGAK